MKGYLKIEYLFIFFLCAYAFTLPFSKYALSVSIFGLSACTLFSDSDKGIRWNKNLFKQLSGVTSNPLFLGFVLYFFTSMISGLWSSDLNVWAFYFVNYLPMIVLPFVFTVNDSLSSRKIHLVLLTGIISMCIQLGLVLLKYYMNYEATYLNILKGKPISTPVSHIRFSLMLAMYIMVLIYFIIKKRIVLFSSEIWLYIILLLYFIVGIHILSVKSGLLGLYFGVFMMSFQYLRELNRLKVLWFVAPGFLLLLILMIIIVPSLNAKFYHILWQIGEYSRGQYRYFSDLERLQSIQFGIKLIGMNPILGTGIGDVINETQKIYSDYLNTSEIKYAHNQFVFSWAYCGLACFLSLVYLLYISFIKKFRFKNILSLGLMSLIWISLLVEYGFGTQIGVCLCVFTFILSYYFDKLEPAISNE